MSTLLRVESWRDGVLVAAKIVPNHNVAKVLIQSQEALGFRTLLVYPRTRTETERAA